MPRSNTQRNLVGQSEDAGDGEKQKRVSRRSSYSKLLGIPSDQEWQTDGAGIELANESFRNSTYGWDLPGVRLSTVCFDRLGLGGAQNEEQEEPEERRKLNDHKYKTTIDSTIRPYTPDKFLTAKGALEDISGNKMKSGAGEKRLSSSGWGLGLRRTKSSSPKGKEEK